jgi:hypothetical protein
MENTVRLSDNYVKHRYEQIERPLSDSYRESISSQFQPSDDIMNYIRQFIGYGVLANSEPIEGFPTCLFIEGDAGIGNYESKNKMERKNKNRR